MAPRRTVARIVATLVAGASVGCFAPDDGRSPPLDRLYFPVGLAVNPAGTRLYVANSDFDLQYNAGTLHAYDLPKLRRLTPQSCSVDADCAVDREGAASPFVCDNEATSDNGSIPSYFCVDPQDPRPCGARREKTPGERVAAPGRCTPIAEAEALAGSVRIGAFATDVVYAPRRDDVTHALDPEGRGRLFIPVRGDATLHWIDLPADRELDCGQDSESACDTNHRRGDDPDFENTTGARMPPEPYGVAVDARGEAIVVTHQSSGAASLFVNEWGGALDGPRLQHVMDGIPFGGIGVSAVPVSRYVAEAPLVACATTADCAALGAEYVCDAARCAVPNQTFNVPYEQSFLITYRTTAQVDLLRYIPDPSEQPEPFLQKSGMSPITALSLGWDSRGIAIDDSARRSCEDDCSSAADVQACRLVCVKTHGLEVYVANRTPASLLLGRTRESTVPAGTDDLPRFYGSIPVAVGVTRIVVGSVRGPAGNQLPRVFAVCFDAKRIYVYDPALRRVETVIQTGNGPQALAVDGEHGLGYVAHFSESYLGVLDLDQSHVNTYGQMLLTVGTPTPPRASK